MKKRIVTGFLLITLCTLPFLSSSRPTLAADKKEEKPKPAQSIAELKTQLEKILADSHTPGMSIAIVHRDSVEWMAGLGKSDVATNHATNEDTLFRIGSTSKAFAALSILKLVDEGKLSLNDPVHNLVPEIFFENKWESTNPVRVVDLLEHTTGWDDMHLPEYAKDAKGMTLREGLDYYKKSRISRWPPGTRMAYCNSGPPVAAYIVEKITGKRFEDYVTENFFLPIGMKTATYFEAPSPQLTTLYHDDGKTPYPYWNILLRPAGAINASARDMAAYVQFYLNRGTVNGAVIMPAANIERMETPTRTWQAQEGQKTGYGLNNYTSFHDGFVYHGHDGGVEGGLTDMSYLPDAGVGYFYSINAGNGDAFEKIGDAIKAYITRSLTRPAVPAVAPLPADAQEYTGWYEPDAPRNQMSQFFERLAGLTYVHFADGKMLTRTTDEWDQPSVPVDGEHFRYLPKKDLPEPMATITLLKPNDEGRFIFYGVTMKHMPAWLAWVEIVLTAWFLLALVATIVYAPFWLIGGLFKSRRRPEERAIRLWPLIAVLSLAAFMTLLTYSGNDAIERLGNITIWSVGIFLSTLLFGIASIMAFFSCVKALKKPIRPFVHWYQRFIIPALVIATIYLMWWGFIGIRTWN